MTRTGRNRRLLAAAAVLACLWLAFVSRIHINVSWSDGAWGYLRLPLYSEPARGDRILFVPPVPSGLPWMKTVLGLPGDRIAVDAARRVTVGGLPAGTVKTHGLRGQELEPVTAGTVPEGHYFLHGGHADSRDSRYADIGPVARDAITGRAVALPDIPWLGLRGPILGPASVAGNRGGTR